MRNPHSQSYETGDAVKDTFHGTDYQINVLILYAFNNFVLKRPFELRTEDENYGKFDDVVLITRQNVEVVQVKHSKDDDGEWTLNCFATKSGKSKKVQFYKYFDSWFEHRDEVDMIYKIYTNHDIIDEHGMDLCLDGTRFKSEFINNPTPPDGVRKNILAKPGLNDQQKIKFCSDHILRHIKLVSEKLNEDGFNENEKNELIKRFLGSVRMVVSQDNVVELSKDIRARFRKHFKTTNNAIYYEFYFKIKDWMRDENVKSHDQKTIGNLFSGAVTRSLFLERLCGLTHQHLQKTRHKIAGKYFLPRPELQTMLQFLQSKNTPKTLFLSGRPGIGKSAIVKMIYKSREQRLLDGQFLFVDVNDLVSTFLTSGKDVDPTKLRSCKVLCVDNFERIEDLDKEARQLLFIFLVQASTRMKLVLLTRASALQQVTTYAREYQLSYHHVSVAPTPLAMVLKKFQSLKPLADPTNLTRIKSTKSTAHYELEGLAKGKLVATPNFFLKALTTPFYLNLIVTHGLVNSFMNSKALPKEAHLAKVGDFVLQTVFSSAKSSLFAQARISALKKIIFASSQNKRRYVQCKAPKQVIQSLLDDDIICSNPNGEYAITHLLYEEWIVKGIVKHALSQLDESGDDPLYLFNKFTRTLPQHDYIIVPTLANSRSLRDAFLEEHPLKDYSKFLARNNYFLLLYYTLTQECKDKLKDIAIDGLLFCADAQPKEIAQFLSFLNDSEILSDSEKTELFNHSRMAYLLLILCKTDAAFRSAAKLLLIHAEVHKHGYNECYYTLLCLFGTGGAPSFVSYAERIAALRGFAFSGHDNDDIVAYLLGAITDPCDGGSEYAGMKISRGFSDKHPKDPVGSINKFVVEGNLITDDAGDHEYTEQAVLLLIAMHEHFKEERGDDLELLVKLFSQNLFEFTYWPKFLLQHMQFEDLHPIYSAIDSEMENLLEMRQERHLKQAEYIKAMADLEEISVLIEQNQDAYGAIQDDREEEHVEEWDEEQLQLLKGL